VSGGRVLAQAGMEVRLALRNSENLLVTLVIPLALLLFLAWVDVLPGSRAERVAFLVPGVLALSVMSSAMVALGIATGFERSWLVLKRLGATPLRRSELLAAKALAVLAQLAIQVAAVLALAVALLGYAPPAGGLWLVPVALALGTAAFAGIGLALAGRLPATGTLAAANGLFVVLLLVSGLVFPLDLLPGWLAAAAGVLPSALLAELLRAALDTATAPTAALTGLTAWAAATTALAAATFRWE
jgi:ABC-2 type transport system permease protein